ncbi:MAG: NAD(P)-dependent oxidoreductase, partial [Actinomycetota bacterium]|nr:NAD(P)-dependent oxidoreductase [Actinomycetota bacterium]
SDGTSWRPLVHIEDISRAFLALAEADRDLVHDEPFNVGMTTENYQIRDVALLVEEIVPGSAVTLSEEAFNDIRNYRVSCDKIARLVPGFKPQWTVRRGIEQLYEQYTKYGLTLDQLEGDQFMRVKHIGGLLESSQLDNDLRWSISN